jgi:sulfite exporter TauE/SafE
MDANGIATPLAAMAAGLVSSVHCVAMCGPLACAVKAKPAQYHASRFISYAIAGALCGAIGQSVALLLKGSIARFAPWSLAVVLLLVGLGLEKRLPQPQWIARVLWRVRLDRSLGWLTPLLPCGPLWLMFGVAVVAGSWWRGAILMAAFAAGTIPLYLLAQTQVLRLQGALSSHALRWTQQSLALVSAALLIWRTTIPLHGSCH